MTLPPGVSQYGHNRNTVDLSDGIDGMLKKTTFRIIILPIKTNYHINFDFFNKCICYCPWFFYRALLRTSNPSVNTDYLIPKGELHMNSSLQ